jgi:MFS family permease
MTNDDRHEPERLTPAPPIAPGRISGRFKGALVGIGPLRRHREYRLAYAAQTITGFGSMVTFVAIPYQAYALSHSSFVVGAVSAVQLVPLVAMALFGGALADAVDRRLLVRATEAAFAICSTLLLLNATLSHPMLWPLFLVGAAMAGLEGLQRPPLDALLPRLVERDEIAQASVLNSLRSNAAAIAGPAIGGVLIAGVGLPAAYGFDLGTFALSLALLSAMRATPPPADAEPPSARRIIEGLRYARSRPELLGTYGVDFVAMFFGMPLALMPALATHLGGPRALGFLYAAPSLGALIASVFGGWTIGIYRHGAAVCLAAIGWGLGIVVLAFAPDLAVALFALAVAGMFDELSGIFRGRIWYETIPDGLRGRLGGIEQISYSTGPLLGDLESGVVASLASVRTSIASGGILCVLGVGVAALTLPAFWRYDAQRFARPADASG